MRVWKKKSVRWKSIQTVLALFYIVVPPNWRPATLFLFIFIFFLFSPSTLYLLLASFACEACAQTFHVCKMNKKKISVSFLPSLDDVLFMFSPCVQIHIAADERKMKEQNDNEWKMRRCEALVSCENYTRRALSLVQHADQFTISNLRIVIKNFLKFS